MNDDSQLDEKELHKLFLLAEKRFFEYNGSKNTPNILEQLNSQIENLKEAAHQTSKAVSSLNISVKEANASSSRLAALLVVEVCLVQLTEHRHRGHAIKDRGVGLEVAAVPEANEREDGFALVGVLQMVGCFV